MNTARTLLFLSSLLLARSLFAEVATGEPVIVASRGTATITTQEVDTLVDQLDARVRAGFLDDPERLENVLNGLLLARQISNEAKAEGLDEGGVFQQRLALAKENILMQMQIEHHLNSLDVPDFTVLARERYQADNGTTYGVPERRDVSHILVSNKTREDAAAFKLITDLQQRIRAGESFDELAKIYSDDKPARPSDNALAPPFWRLKEVVPGKTDKAFEDAAWALQKAGDVSGIVKSSFGYHIIRLDEVKPMEKAPFESVSRIIVNKLTQAWRDKMKTEYVTSFRVQPIDADPGVIESLRTRYVPEASVTTPSSESANAPSH
ncbi:MAG: peptidylprolyl isomerase [Lysobacteraceae bacterium]